MRRIQAEMQCNVSTVSNAVCWCRRTALCQVKGQRGRLPGDFRALHTSVC